MHSDPFIDHLDDLQKDFELGEGTALRNGESVTDSLDKERLDLDPLHLESADKIGKLSCVGEFIFCARDHQGRDCDLEQGPGICGPLTLVEEWETQEQKTIHRHFF